MEGEEKDKKDFERFSSPCISKFSEAFRRIAFFMESSSVTAGPSADTPNLPLRRSGVFPSTRTVAVGGGVCIQTASDSVGATCVTDGVGEECVSDGAANTRGGEEGDVVDSSIHVAKPTPN